jgi:HEAT repeat protein
MTRTESAMPRTAMLGVPLLLSSFSLITAVALARQTPDDEEEQRSLRDQLARYTQAQAAQKDTRSIPELINSLTNETADVRRQAALVLGRRDEGVESAIPGLLEALKDVDGEVRREVVLTLATIGCRLEAEAKRDGVATAMLSLIKDPDVMVRSASILGLSYFTRSEMTRVASEPQIVKVTIDALADSHWSVRSVAASSIGWIRSPPKEALGPLLKCLGDANRNVRSASIRALQKYEAAAKPAVPALIVLLSDQSPRLRNDALLCLGALKGEAAEAAPAVKKALNDRVVDIRMQAAISLEQITSTAEASVPILVQIMQDKSLDNRMRRVAAWALKDFGPKAKAAIPALKDALNDESELVRGGAAAALQAINPDVSGEKGKK